MTEALPGTAHLHARRPESRSASCRTGQYQEPLQIDLGVLWGHRAEPLGIQFTPPGSLGNSMYPRDAVRGQSWHRLHVQQHSRGRHTKGAYAGQFETAPYISDMRARNVIPWPRARPR